jgi:dolichyl-phosphate-mannose-protein mannosyltransferase
MTEVASSSVASIPSSPAPAGEAEQQKPVAQDSNQAVVSEKPGPQVISQEERVEYRDQDGNLLNEEQIKELQGKVKFETKYETRTRVVDEQGNELPVPEGGWPADMVPGVAPPHPDVHGGDPETVKGNKAEVPQDAAASRDGEKEAERSRAKPASEGQEATVRDEL